LPDPCVPNVVPQTCRLTSLLGQRGPQSRVFHFTGKKTASANRVTIAARRIPGRGRTKITGITSRKFKANIHKVRAVTTAGWCGSRSAPRRSTRHGGQRCIANIQARGRKRRLSDGQQKITPDQVRHVAKLSRLALDENRLARFAGQLETILATWTKSSGGYQRRGTDGPCASGTQRIRDDVVEPSLPWKRCCKRAGFGWPFFKVPKVIGGDEDSAG